MKAWRSKLNLGHGVGVGVRRCSGSFPSQYRSARRPPETNPIHGLSTTALSQESVLQSMHRIQGRVRAGPISLFLFLNPSLARVKMRGDHLMFWG